MKIESLAIIFIIIILTISLVLQTYTQNRINTLSEQILYDSKLNDATYDALKAYQINNLNAGAAESANEKMRDIKASVNTFFNSMSNSFKSLGYTKESIQNYVPALVYTMYDGYYIYSPYVNNWNGEDFHQVGGQNATYRENQTLFGLKPYVYYSCRYVRGNIDVVITYTLDNYVTIQGTINGKECNESGYLLSNVQNNGTIVTYNGIQIPIETNITENVYMDGEYRKNLPCIKKNGQKYYVWNNKVYTILNGKSNEQTNNITVNEVLNNSNAQKYYKEAVNFRAFIVDNHLDDLTTANAVGIEDKELRQKFNQQNLKIFDFDHSIGGFSGGIEAETSNFNEHRRDIIKYSVERNLSIAIANFNSYSSETSVNFQMPKLKETDWDKILNNISLITFLQGMNIGNGVGKIYNGYSIVTNNKNKDVVTEDSIVIKASDNIIHDVTETNLNNIAGLLGIYNINTELWSSIDQNGDEAKYYPVDNEFSYVSMIEKRNLAKGDNETLAQYLTGKQNLATAYYTALGRERYGLYRSTLILDIPTPTTPAPVQVELKDASNTTKANNNFATITSSGTIGGTGGSGSMTYISGISYKGNMYTSNDIMMAESELNGAIIYISGRGYFKFIATTSSSGNAMIPNPSAWQYLGNSILVNE